MYTKRKIFIIAISVVFIGLTSLVYLWFSSDLQPVKLILEIPSAVTIGQESPLRLHIRNESEATLDLRLAGKPAHAFVLRDSQGDIVWESDSVILDMYEIKTLQSGEEFVLETNLYENPLYSPSLSPGKYTLQGVLHLSEPNRTLQSQVETIELR